ncbi:MFS transporter [Streptomyces halobius]|uniref:MFS transporter n=1 Tax=Streptomyces halobius TaxID=2879846 RepID=A0ABY4M2I0_9ACTN|nr:MFS transporter [Streptomyces halobius]UQA91971.1 MFS transporter [Streptomyces halobius]
MDAWRVRRAGAVLPLLVYCGLCTTVISSLGALLIPAVAADQRVPVSTAQWMLTGNLLVGAVTTPVLGRLADGPRSRRMLLLALTVVALGSALAATAETFPQLLAGRALQGPTCGMVPVTMALARRHLPSDRVGRAIATLAVTAATGAGLSCPLTGFIAQHLDFHWAFWLALAFVAPAFAGVLLILPPDRADREPRPAADPVGVALLAAGLVCLILLAGQGAQWGWRSPAVLGLLLGTLLSAGGWAWWERPTGRPLVRPALLGRSDVVLANVAAFALGAAAFVGLSAVGTMAQAPASTGYGLDLSVFAGGCLMLPMSAGSQSAGRLSRRLTAKAGPRATLAAGAALVAVAQLCLSAYHYRLWHLLLAIALLGLGTGLTWTSVPMLVHGAVPAGELGSVLSFNHVLRIAGSTLGSAATGAVLAAHTAADGLPGDAGYRMAFTTSAAGCGLVLVGILSRMVAESSRQTLRHSG